MGVSIKVDESKSEKKNSMKSTHTRLFREAMADVKPIGFDKKKAMLKSVSDIPHFTLKNRRLAAMAHLKKQVNLGLGLSDHAELVAPEEKLMFKREGTAEYGVKLICSGCVDIEDTLDMHGMTIKKARAELQKFIHYCTRYYFKYVRVIHGKSHQRYVNCNNSQWDDVMATRLTLKSLVNAWLRQLPQVVGFVSCQTRDGGTGAVYVCLSSEREDKYP